MLCTVTIMRTQSVEATDLLDALAKTAIAEGSSAPFQVSVQPSGVGGVTMTVAINAAHSEEARQKAIPELTKTLATSGLSVKSATE